MTTINKLLFFFYVAVSLKMKNVALPISRLELIVNNIKLVTRNFNMKVDAGVRTCGKF